jgi:hypothetical protein
MPAAPPLRPDVSRARPSAGRRSTSGIFGRRLGSFAAAYGHTNDEARSVPSRRRPRRPGAGFAPLLSMRDQTVAYIAAETGVRWVPLGGESPAQEHRAC